VYRDGHIALDRQTVTLEQLRAHLAAARGEYQDLGVVVRGDAEGSFQNVVNVLNACRQAGISQMGISVRLDRKDR
jgi:biopolymer transport protein ExbD